MHHIMFLKTWTLALISLELLVLTTAETSANDAIDEVPEDGVSGNEFDSRKVPIDLSSILMGPNDARYPDVPIYSTTPSLKSNDYSEETYGSENHEYFPKRLHPSNVVSNFDRENFVKVFTYEPAPELDVPQNETVAYLLEVMTEINENIDRLILQAAREVSEYYSKVSSASEDASDGQDAPGELYDLVYKNLKALLGTLDDYPVLKESLYLWSSQDGDGDDGDQENIGDDSSEGPAGRAFKFSKKTKTTPAPPKFVCPAHITELVNCWSYDVLDSVSDSAKYYLSPFTW